MIRSCGRPNYCKDLNSEGLHYDIPLFIQDFPDYAYVKSAKDFSFLFTNKRYLDFLGLESPEELKGKTIFDIQKLMPDKFPKNAIKKISLNEEKVLKTKNCVFFQGDPLLSHDGYVVCYSSMKIPFFDPKNKIKVILTLVFDLTKNEDIIDLFYKYKKMYKKNEELRNKKFLEYIGISQNNESLTTDELKCLVSFYQNRNLEQVAKDLETEQKTLEKYLHNIKLKLGIDLYNILKHFTLTEYRKF